MNKAHVSGLDLLPATIYPAAPEPVPDCATCDELGALRSTARAEYDRTREADANVLLRRHQRQAHPGSGESAPTRRRIFRYVPYSIVQDGSAEPEYEACCVSGDEDDCGAVSGRHRIRRRSRSGSAGHPGDPAHALPPLLRRLLPAGTDGGALTDLLRSPALLALERVVAADHTAAPALTTISDVTMTMVGLTQAGTRS